MSTAPSPLRDEFRAAMRRLASTVCIAAAEHDGRRTGMTMTAVTSVSLDPPALLICARRSSGLHAALSARRPFCVNLLRVGHDEVAAAFGGGASGDAKFHVGDWVCDGEAPCLADALASVFCAVAGSVDHGTHTIFVGEVRDVRLNGPGAPLIYGDGRYGPG